jgi:hypothetical protein
MYSSYAPGFLLEPGFLVVSFFGSCLSFFALELEDVLPVPHFAGVPVGLHVVERLAVVRFAAPAVGVPAAGLVGTEVTFVGGRG